MRTMDGPYRDVSPLEDRRLAQMDLHFPIVSVVVTNYNYSQYIAACLQSIAQQTYRHFECIIVDDKSTDDSIHIIRNFIESEEAAGRFRLECHALNSGQMAAFRTGMERSRGAFIVFVDADDLLFDDFLHTHLNVHLCRSPVAFTSSNQWQIDQDGKIIAGIHPELEHLGRERLIPPRPIHKRFWVWATTSSMMFRRPILEMILPESRIALSFPVCADNYVCLYANLVGGSMLIPTVHGCYRRHGSNCFSTNPIIGSCLPTGDVRCLPQHYLVKKTIQEHLIHHKERFIVLLSKKRYAYTLACIDNPFVMMMNIKQYSNFLDLSKVSVAIFAFRALMQTMKDRLWFLLNRVF